MRKNYFNYEKKSVINLYWRDHWNDKRQSSKKVKILFIKRRKGDLVKIIASNKKLMKFIKWRPKYNNLSKIVQSCLNWEKRQ